MTPEGRRKAKLNRALKKLEPRAWRFMPVQNGMGKQGLDYFLCVHSGGRSPGRFVAIETKADGGKMTPLQEKTAADIRAAGGTVFLVNSDESQAEAIAFIQGLLP